MADRQVLSAPLCFIFTKLCKTDIKRIKTAVADCYDSEEITAARDRLVSDAAALKLDEMPIIAKLRNSDSRHQRECDDILDVITFLDEHKLLDKLPRYACDSSDYFPHLGWMKQICACYCAGWTQCKRISSLQVYKKDY